MSIFPFGSILVISNFFDRFFSPKSAEKIFGHVSDQYEQKRKKKFLPPVTPKKLSQNFRGSKIFFLLWRFLQKKIMFVLISRRTCEIFRKKY